MVYFEDSAIDDLNRLGYDTGSLKKTSDSNKPSYKVTATGPNGHKIGSNDDQKTWYDMVTGKQL